MTQRPRLLLVLAALAILPLSGSAPDAGTDSSIKGLFDGLPMAFIENRGQWDSPARFIAQRGCMLARLEPRR